MSDPISMSNSFGSTAEQVESAIKIAVEKAKNLGWTIVRDKTRTLSFFDKTCCPFGAFQAIAGEGALDTFAVLKILDVGMTWVADFTMGFDDISVPLLNNPDAYALGKKLALEYLK